MSGAELWEQLAGVAPMMLRALLADMTLESFDGRLARLRCRPEVRAVAEKKLDDLARLISSLSGGSVRVELVRDAAFAQPDEADDGPRPDTAGTPSPDTDHPLVARTLEIFNGRIVEVKPIRSRPAEE